MKSNIYLISTIHKERGNCTSDGLFQILDKINPDVVFCEISPKTFELLNKRCLHSSLELNSIKRLSEYHSFSFVAIDSHQTPTGTFRNQVMEMFEPIDKDKKYFELSIINDGNTNKFGFEYLNSDECIKVFEKMAEIENSIISQLPNREYKATYSNWLKLNDSRENEMLENINSYIENNEFKNAVFLCGSAHRKSLIYKIKMENNIQIKWKFDLP